MLDLLLILAPYWITRVYVRNHFIKFFIYVSILLRQLIAFANSLPGVQLFGSAADARRFLTDATSLAWQPSRDFPMWLTDGYSPFVYGLRYLNKISEFLIQIFNPEFTFQLLNIFVFILSIALIESRFGRLYYDKLGKLAILIALFYPFSLTFHTYVVRESFQLLLISLTLSLFSIPFRLNTSKIILLVLILSAAPVFHFAYPFPILASLALFTFLSGFSLRKIQFSVVVLVILTPFVFLLINQWLEFSTIASLSDNLSLPDAQEVYLRGAVLTNEQDETRTFYFNEASNIFLLPLYYRFKPFITDIRSIFDLFLFSANLLATFIYIKTSMILARQRALLKRQQELILLSILSLIPYDLFWSIGTVNWGTAARHSSATTILVLMLFSHYRASREPCNA